MAATINSSPTGIEIRLVYVDEAGEPAPMTISIDDAADADIEQFLDDMAALSNAILSAKIVYVFEVTGIITTGKPSTSAQSLVAAILAMEFSKANPLNAAKTVTKQVMLPAYVNAIRDDTVKPHIPVTTSAPLNDATAFLAAHLDYVDVAGTHHAGGWSFNLGSKFGTRPTVTDGF